VLCPFSTNFFKTAHQVTSLLASILTRKLRLHIQSPLQRHAVLTEEDRERLFDMAVETIEMTYKLRTDPRIQKWHWFFSSYNQWHALAYTIYSLCLKPLGRKANRGWRAVEETAVLRWNATSGVRREAHQWRNVMKMLDRAKLAKRKTLQSIKAKQRNTAPQSSQSGSFAVEEGQLLGPRPHNLEVPHALLAQLPTSVLQTSSENQLSADDMSSFLEFEYSLVDANQFSFFEIPGDRFISGDAADFDFEAIMRYRHED
jgi:hypothetical protein